MEPIKRSACCSVNRKDVAGAGVTTQAPVKEIKSDPQKTKKDDQVFIPGGRFFMGTNGKEGYPEDGEGPARNIEVSPFYMDVHTVTNREFQAFVEDTGYVTKAEAFGWSFVFYQFASERTKRKIKRMVQQTP